MSEKTEKPINILCSELRYEKGYSREEACMRMNDDIKPDRLEKIENNKVKTITPEEIVCMAKAYDHPELCNYYCLHSCEIGKKFGRESSVKDLTHIAVDTLNSLNRLNAAKIRLLEIVEDDKVTEDEMEDFINIRSMIEKIASTADSLKYWMENENIKID